MINFKFTLRNDLSDLNGNSIGRFDAFFPDIDAENKPVNYKEIPDYVKIEDAIFKKKYNGGNYSVFISPGVLKDSPKNNPRVIDCKEATEREYFWYRVFHDKSQKLAFQGLIIAAVGAIIDAAFAIGKIHVLIPVSDAFTVWSLVMALILKAVGLWLVFSKGFRDAK